MPNKIPLGGVLLVTLFAGGLDLVVGPMLWHQLVTAWWPTTAGRIIESRVTVYHGFDENDGDIQDAAVRYGYRVQGRNYSSDRVRFVNAGDSKGDWAHETVAENPVGAVRPVHYNPADPSAAVLHSGLEGGDLGWAFCALLLNGAAVYAWLATMDVRFATSVPGGVTRYGGAQVETTANEIRVRFQKISAVHLGVMVFLFVGISTTFVIMIFSGDNLSAGNLGFIGLLSFFAGASSFLAWRFGHNRAGPEVVLNLARSTLTRLRAPRPVASVPASRAKIWREWKATRFIPIVVPLEQILSVKIEGPLVDQAGNPTLHFVSVIAGAEDGGPPRMIPLASWRDWNAADEFATWLAATLGLSA